METTNPLSAERVEELRGRTECARTRGRGLLDRDYADLLTILDDYSALKAENELLRKDNNYFHAGFDSVREDYEEQKARAEKSEAQLAKVCERNKLMDETFGSLLEKNINLEAELARQAPLIEPSGEKAKTIIEKDSGPRQRCSGCGRQAADDPTFPDDYCVKCWPDHKALLRDKLQSWPGDMALSSDDIADLFALIESSGEKGDEPLLPENVWKTTLRELRELREVTVNPVDLATIHRACLVLDELLFIRRQPAPSPGPSSSIEGYPASVKQALTVPAPLLAAKLSSYLEKKHE